MRLLCCLFLSISLAAAVPSVEFRIVFKSEWVRGYPPRHQIMVNGTHPVVFLTRTENRTCDGCPSMQHLDTEYIFLQTQERYLLTLGDKWKFLVRASIVHTCFFLKPGFVCNTETITNRGHLTFRRSDNTMFGHGTFLHLLGSMYVPGLQYLIDRHENVRMHWREPLWKLKAKSVPANVWMTLIRDSFRSLVGCSARWSSPFPITVSLVDRNGATVSGKEVWSFMSVNASATSNDLSFDYCRVESILGWSIVIAHIPEGFQMMRLLEYDRRQERNEWKDETIVVRPSHTKPVTGETYQRPTESRQPLDPWTIFCSSAVMLVVAIACFVAFVCICHRYMSEERNSRRERDLENDAVDYMRF